LEPSIAHQAWNLPLATKLGTFHCPPSLEPSIGHQAWNLPLATQLGTSISHQTWNIPLATELGTSIGHQAWDLPSPPFPFSFKGELGSLGVFFFLKHNFQFNFEKICSYELLRNKRMINLGSWEKEGE
jgi:hypothetical protein